jgi:hypothetical protein
MPLSKKPGWIAWRSCAARAIIKRNLLPRGRFSNAILFLPRISWLATRKSILSSLALLFWIISKSASNLIGSKPRKNTLLPNKRRSTLFMTANFIQGRHTTRGSSICSLPNHCCDKISRTIKDEMHLHYKTSKKLQLSRLEYKPFKTRIFQDRILQEIRLKKCVHYLQLKRAKQIAPPKPKASPKHKTTGKRKK